MASHSTSLPIRPLFPQSSKPFRFRDLPGEIRNKIYENVLCSVVPREETSEEGYKSQRPDKLRLFEEDWQRPTKITYLRHSIEPQILRTCRSIYDEGTYIMRKTNCFVKVTISLADHDLEFILRGIPILYTTRKRAKDFKHPIMVHEITASVPERTRSFIILQRDLGLFCKGVEEYNLLTPEYNAFHNLTLVDPYESQPLLGAPKFLSRKLQDLLLAPYRKLRGFPLFTIKGAVEKDLSRDAVSEITSSRIGTDPELYLADLAELKSKGNDFFRAGANELAGNAYQQGLVKILSIGSIENGGTAEGERLQEIGGPDFCNRVSALLFDMNSNAAQTMLKMPRIHYTKISLDAQEYMERRFYTLIDACHIARFPGSTWMPSSQQMGKVFYREAAGSRIFGNLERALNAINSATDNIPNNVELQREKERILRAMGWARVG